MSTDPSLLPPHLLVDLGGTLIKRARPGAYTRAGQVLTAHGVDLDDRASRDVLARCLLTGLDRADAVAAASDALQLTSRTTASLGEALAEPEGEASILPGALDLLATATAQGWRVIAVTNAAAWAGGLPSAVEQQLTAVESSSELGLLKQDPAFWQKVLGDHAVNPARCMVIGDDARADDAVPAGEGLCCVPLQPGRLGLAEITGWLGAAPPPPKEVLALVAGVPEEWAGQLIMTTPHLDRLVTSVTRCRVRVHGYGPRVVTAALVRRRHLATALVLPDSDRDLASGGRLAWLQPMAERRAPIVPTDLRATLTQHGLSTVDLSNLDLRHLISMVREARDPHVRLLRIHDVVTFLKNASRNLA